MFIGKICTMLKGYSRRFNQLLILTLIIATAFFFESCGKVGEMEWVYYDETQCSDAWERSAINETLKENVIDYFEGKGVRVYELEVYADRPGLTCQACTCKTGRRIKAKVKARDVSTMKEEGFYK